MADMQWIMQLGQIALRSGWTQEKARGALIAHLDRERRYLDRRRAQGKLTSYDTITEADQFALALAICFLTPDTTGL